MNKLKIPCILILSSLIGSSVMAYPVAELRVEGVTSDQVEVIKTLSGILPGDEYEKAKVARGGDKIQDYYSGKGFPQVAVNSEILQAGEKHVLLFKVDLGPAVRIAEVSFICREEKLPLALLNRLIKTVDLKNDEYFDRDRIKEMRRAVESVLFAQNFIDSKVADLTTEYSPSGLKLSFVIQLGQKVVLSVSGNQYYARSELMTFIETQRALGLGRDYVNVLSTRLRELYVEHGFRGVKITPYSFEPHDREPKKLVFDIEEGPRVMIRSLIFDGNEVFKAAELTEFFYKSASDRVAARIYNAKMVEDAAHAMVDELKKRGYLSAKLIAIKTEDAPDSSVDLRIFVTKL